MQCVKCFSSRGTVFETLLWSVSFFVCCTQNFIFDTGDDIRILPSLYLISPSFLYPRQRLPEERDAPN